MGSLGIPDVSQLPIQSPDRQFNLQNTEVALTPQPLPPEPGGIGQSAFPGSTEDLEQRSLQSFLNPPQPQPDFSQQIQPQGPNPNDPLEQAHSLPAATRLAAQALPQGDHREPALGGVERVARSRAGAGRSARAMASDPGTGRRGTRSVTTLKEKAMRLAHEPKQLPDGRLIAPELPPKRKPQFKVTDKQRSVARDVLRKGLTIGEALRKAGYSAVQSKKGMALVRKHPSLAEAFRAETRKIEEESKQDPLFPVEGALEGLIMNRLQTNIVAGEDKAVMSCKLAGSHKKLNLWTPELQQGIVIINAPGQPLTDPAILPEDPE